MDKADPQGVVLTEGNCYIEAALNATLKIMQLMGRDGIKLAHSTVRPRNPFPNDWRSDAYTIGMHILMSFGELVKYLYLATMVETEKF